MTELKTLKDLECWEGRQLATSSIRDELKAEAVKWVKYFEGLNELMAISMWKDFFNLTEEEIK